MEDIDPKIEDGGATADGRLSADEYNDRNEELENSVTRSGQALASSNTLQLAESLFLNSIKAHSFTDVGAVNAVDLRPESGATGVKVPSSYANMEGGVVSFKPANNNTGATTVNIGQTSGIGAKALVLSTDGSALVGGELDTTQTAQIQYNAANDEWELLPWSIPAATVSFPILISQGGTSATTAADARTNLDVPPNSRELTVSGLITGGGTLASDRNFDVTASSQAQAEAGTDNTTAMTPLRVAQAIEALGGVGGVVAITAITSTGLTVYDPDVNGASRVVIIATAGGGGSGSPNVTTDANEQSGSSGGGAGGTCIHFYEFDTGATTLDVTVGAGGAGAADGTGASGGNGSNTTVTETDGPQTNLITCVGGDGSSGTVSGFGITGGELVTQPDAGGGVTVGQIKIQGGDSHPAMIFADSLTGIGGNGGASYWGGGGRGSRYALTSQGSVYPGVAPGSGAGGAASRNGLIGQNTQGADGADGIVIIIEYA